MKIPHLGQFMKGFKAVCIIQEKLEVIRVPLSKKTTDLAS